MATVKDEAKRLIDRLPDDITWRELVEELERQEEEQDPVAQKLDEVYAEEGSSEIDPAVYAMALASLPRDSE